MLLTVLAELLTIEHEAIHNILNLHFNESTSDRGQLHPSRRTLNGFHLEEIVRRHHLSNFEKGDEV
jgi:hypothetical protein